MGSKLLLMCSLTLTFAAQDGSTALCYAASNGHLDVVRLLIQKGADVKTANKVTTLTVILKMLLAFLFLFECHCWLFGNNRLILAKVLILLCVSSLCSFLSLRPSLPPVFAPTSGRVPFRWRGGKGTPILLAYWRQLALAKEKTGDNAGWRASMHQSRATPSRSNEVGQGQKGVFGY